jgi:hypothetical protein
MAAARAYLKAQKTQKQVLIYVYQYFTWSIDLTAPGMAKRLLWFTVEKVHHLEPLPHMNKIPWRRRVTLPHF